MVIPVGNMRVRTPITKILKVLFDSRFVASISSSIHRRPLFPQCGSLHHHPSSSPIYFRIVAHLLSLSRCVCICVQFLMFVYLLSHFHSFHVLRRRQLVFCVVVQFFINRSKWFRIVHVLSLSFIAPSSSPSCFRIVVNVIVQVSLLPICSARLFGLVFSWWCS